MSPLIRTLQDRILRRGGRPLALLVLVAGLGATAWGTASIFRHEQARGLRAFQTRSEQYFARTMREVQTYMEVLDSIRHIHSLSEQVQAEAFEEMAGKGMLYQRHVLGAYGFAQAIPGGIRAAYEQQVAPILRISPDGGLEADLERPVYYPLVYQAPPGAFNLPTGYNFGSRDEDVFAIRTMEMAGVFTLGGKAQQPDTWFMFAPILMTDEQGRILGLRGFAVSLFQPMRILAAAGGADAQPLPAKLQPLEEAAELNGDSAWQFQQQFILASREWQFTIEADAATRAAFRTRAPEQAALAGGLITLFVSGLLLMIASRTRQVEILVERRTEELASANARRHELEKEILRISAEERARVGRDLHDSIGQKLTGVLYLFSAYRKAHPAPESEVITETLKTAVGQIRRIARGLAPVELSEENLADALQQMAAESAELFSCNVEFFHEGDGRPQNATAAEHLLLIAQEAVHNACRHGKPGRVLVTLDYSPEEGTLLIEDDGSGFVSTDPPSGEGNGLRIMQHRAELIGARLDIGKSTLGGVHIACHFPALAE